MAREQYSQRYLEELIEATLEGEVLDQKVQVIEENHLRISGRIYVDSGDPEETRAFLEELVEAELPGWLVRIEGVFISRNLPPNLLFHVQNAAQFPEAVYYVEDRSMSKPSRYLLWIRHQDIFLGKKRNRIKKLLESCPDVKLELRALGRQDSAKELNTLPKVQEWIAPFLSSMPDFSAEHVHAYKVDANRESIRLAHNSEAEEKSLLELSRKIARASDIEVIFEKRMSRADAKARVEQAFGAPDWISGYHITFQEKQSLFIVAVDTEQSKLEKLDQMSRELTSATGFNVQARIDIKRDVMNSRMLDSFPEDGIVTWIKHVDANLYEVEAYIPFDPRMERLEAWSDEMEQVWGAKIMFSDAFMRSPDLRYRHLRGSDAETIALRYNRPKAFSEEALAVARKTAVIDWDAELERRLDFRATPVMSIDPERTKDLDDALSITENSDGTFEIGVHIADVAPFVPLGSTLDQEALARGFTTYLNEGEIPVIPPLLSDDACSLHGGKDSLAMSCFIRMDSEGNTLGYEVKRTIVHNHCRFAYAQAQAILDGEDHKFAWHIRTLGDLSRKMRARRKASGALDLSLDADPEKASHQLIEEFMLQANECISRFLGEKHPLGICLFRVHPDITESTLEALNELAQHLKVSVKIENQASMQKALEELLGTPSFDVMRYHVGRVLEKATYHVDRLGHGALAKEDYAHFTSPIRRYTDLIIHRLIEDALYAEERGGASSYERDELLIIADHLNHMEVRVDAGSFESHRLADLQHYDGARRTYTGRILSFMKGRIAIKSEQTDLLMNVRYRDYKQDKLMPLSINDEISGRYFSLGEEVNVRTEGVDWGSKNIDAKIVP